jgi:hypothetical protein
MFLTNEQILRKRCEKALELLAAAITTILTTVALMAAFICR